MCLLFRDEGNRRLSRAGGMTSPERLGSPTRIAGSTRASPMRGDLPEDESTFVLDLGRKRPDSSSTV
jgi:hypothetical protein